MLETRRANYRKRHIPKYYKWQIHVLFNIFLPLSIAIAFGFKISGLRPLELLVFPFILLLGNLTVWLIHKYPLHRKNLFPYAYHKHTVEHHSFFNHENIIFDHPKDLYIVLVGVELSVGFTLVYLPLVYFGLGMIVSDNIRDLFIVASALYFMLYEFVHTVCHVKESSPFLKIKWLSAMREHHRLHHDPKNMNKNYNVVFPLSDYLFGTLIKNKE